MLVFPGNPGWRQGVRQEHRQGVWERQFTVSVWRRTRLVNHSDKRPAVFIPQLSWFPRDVTAGREFGCVSWGRGEPC